MNNKRIEQLNNKIKEYEKIVSNCVLFKDRNEEKFKRNEISEEKYLSNLKELKEIKRISLSYIKTFNLELAKEENEHLRWLK